MSRELDRVHRPGLSARRIPLTNAFNFRDVGGVPAGRHERVRLGYAYRSDGLHRLGGADLALHLEEHGYEWVREKYEETAA